MKTLKDLRKFTTKTAPKGFEFYIKEDVETLLKDTCDNCWEGNKHDRSEKEYCQHCKLQQILGEPKQ